MLTLENLRITLGDFELVADLSVKTGQRVAIIGPSGAGKSTLLGAIAGFIQPASGRIMVDGRDITDAEPAKRPVAMLFQDSNLFPHLTVAQNVGLGLRPSLRLSSQETDQVNSALDRVGLRGFQDRKPAALSGGQQSRVALARTLLRDRPVMLLDEPFAALGPGLKAEMLDLVLNLANDSGTTILMVTHDPNDALQLAGDTILIADGHAQPPQDTQTLFDNPPEALRDYLN